MIVKVTLEDRSDGGIRVYSEQLPGLNLSGMNRAKVIAAIEPAVRAMFRYKGNEPPKNLRIDATFVAECRASNAKTGE